MNWELIKEVLRRLEAKIRNKGVYSYVRFEYHPNEQWTFIQFGDFSESVLYDGNDDKSLMALLEIIKKG